jgi:hypothetical protein
MVKSLKCDFLSLYLIFLPNNISILIIIKPIAAAMYVTISYLKSVGNFIQ